MKIFILACGQQDRFKCGIKQLLKVDGETLLDRMIRLCKPHKPTIVTWKPELEGFDADYHFFDERNCVLNTLKSTRQLWHHKNIVLLGDVMYTEDSMKRILECDKDLCFFTDINDIFAFVFTGNYPGDIAYHLSRCIDINKNEVVTRFRHLFAYFGSRWDSLELICDETQDFDQDLEYDEFLEGKSKNRLFNLMKTYK